MSDFTGHLGLTLYDDDQGRAVLRAADQPLWFVSPPLTYMVGSEDSGLRITVPSFHPEGLTQAEIEAAIAAGTAFVTDLGSIPKIAWSLGFSPSGPEAKAFVLHDYGYSRRGVDIAHQYRADGSLAPVSLDREQVDGLLLEAMGVLGINEGHARIIFDAVREFGAHGWGS